MEVNSKTAYSIWITGQPNHWFIQRTYGQQWKAKKQNVGLERSYDTVLSGHDGQKLVRYIAGGTAIPVEGSQTDPVNGKDIFTTLDVNIQDITETALMKMMLQCEGPYGTAIVMETSTGKIKAMANLGRRSGWQLLGR